MKQCSLCKITKELTEFWKNKVSKDGHGYRCKLCGQLHNKTYRREHRERLKMLRYKREQEFGSLGRRYKSYKANAKSRDLEFRLSEAQFRDLTGRQCSYCGRYSKVQKTADKHVGLDRLDNNIGYTISNVCPCCNICNWMKGKLGMNDFLDYITAIANNQKNAILITREERVSNE